VPRSPFLTPHKSQTDAPHSIRTTTPQLLDRAASAQVRVDQARHAAELSAHHHLDLAAATFEILKGYFGNKGPCAYPREQLVKELRARSTAKTGLSPPDADEQLRLMLRLLPAWMRLDHPAGVSLADMRVVVRIHRRMPWPELRRQLLERVAAARVAAVAAAGKDAEAAAAAEAADLAQAALDAAVARAEAAAAAQDSGGAASSVAKDGAVDDAEEAEGSESAAADEQADGDGSPAQADVAVAVTAGRVEPEALAACLKARIWGQQQAAAAGGGSS